MADSGLPLTLPPLEVSVVQDSVSFSAQCPTCKNEVRQEPHDPTELRKLLREDRLNFSCGLCDHEWKPSPQELANVQLLLSKPMMRGGWTMDSLETYRSETQQVVKRFRRHWLRFPDCIAALDAALAVANSNLPPEQLPALRAMVLANKERVVKEMEKRERDRIKQHERSKL